jgi:hypothetical protein
MDILAPCRRATRANKWLAGPKLSMRWTWLGLPSRSTAPISDMIRRVTICFAMSPCRRGWLPPCHPRMRRPNTDRPSDAAVDGGRYRMVISHAPIRRYSRAPASARTVMIVIRSSSVASRGRRAAQKFLSPVARRGVKFIPTSTRCRSSGGPDDGGITSRAGRSPVFESWDGVARADDSVMSGNSGIRASDPLAALLRQLRVRRQSPAPLGDQRAKRVRYTRAR